MLLSPSLQYPRPSLRNQFSGRARNPAPKVIGVVVPNLVERYEVAALIRDALVQALLREPGLAEQPALVPGSPIAQHRHLCSTGTQTSGRSGGGGGGVGHVSGENHGTVVSSGMWCTNRDNNLEIMVVRSGECGGVCVRESADKPLGGGGVRE